jgi:L-fuculose-phosphate aldolase
MRFPAERKEIVRICQAMVADGLIVGTSGNVSIRVGDEVLITPSGVAYDLLTPEMMATVDLDGNVIEGTLKPSTEVPMHTLVYRQTDAGAIVHAHPMYGTVLGTLVDVTPTIHYNLSAFGGPVRVAPYATFGTDELADGVREALVGRSAVLLQNHGSIVWAPTAAQAYGKALVLEWICELSVRAMSAGRPHLIGAAEVEHVRQITERIGYGRPQEG